MNTKKLISLLVMALCVAAIPAACSDGDNGDGTGEPDPVTQKGYRYTGIFDVTVDHAIEAGDKTGVEADLKANPPLPQGAPYRYWYTIQRYAAALPPSVTLTYADGNGDEVVGLVTQTNKDPGMLPDTYRLLPPATDVSGCMEWRVETGGSVQPYDVFIHTPVKSCGFAYLSLRRPHRKIPADVPRCRRHGRGAPADAHVQVVEKDNS